MKRRDFLVAAAAAVVAKKEGQEDKVSEITNGTYFAMLCRGILVFGPHFTHSPHHQAALLVQWKQDPELVYFFINITKPWKETNREGRWLRLRHTIMTNKLILFTGKERGKEQRGRGRGRTDMAPLALSPSTATLV